MNKAAVVVAIVIKDHKILASRVKKEKLEDFNGIEYVFPGGSVEPGETLEYAVFREVAEETGYHVKPIKKIAERVHPITNKKMHYFHCELIREWQGPRCAEEDDIAETLWIQISEIKTYMPTLFDKVEQFLATS